MNVFETKRLVIDVDGVLLNHFETFVTWSNSTDNDLPTLPTNPERWITMENMQEEINRHADLTDKNFSVFPLMEESVPNHIKKLRKKYEIWIVTDFPKKYEEFRRRNLEYHGIEYDNMVFAKGRKLDIIEKIQPVAVIEDRPKTILQLVKSKKFNGQIWCPLYWNYVKTMRRELDNIRKDRIKYYDRWDNLIQNLYKNEH